MHTGLTRDFTTTGMMQRLQGLQQDQDRLGGIRLQQLQDHMKESGRRHEDGEGPGGGSERIQQS